MGAAAVSKILAFIRTPVSWLALAVLAAIFLAVKVLPDKDGSDRTAQAMTASAAAEALVADGRLPSVSLAVAGKRGSVVTAVHGVMDTVSREPASQTTLYEAASLTKPVVAVIAMRLYDRGVFDLDEPVAAVVEAPRIADREAYAAVTPRHLLSHSSGLPNWSGDYLQTDRTSPLAFRFPPGTAFYYSGEGYQLLQAFLEEKTGRPIADLADDLFRQLGMENSSLAAATLEGAYARGHLSMYSTRDVRRTDQGYAAYSMVTTAHDYGLFLKFFVNGAGVSKRTFAEFTTVQVPVLEESIVREGVEEAVRLGWSLGWGVLERGEDRVFFQWGHNNEFRAFTGASLLQGKAVVFLANSSDGLRHIKEIAGPVLGEISPVASWVCNC